MGRKVQKNEKEKTGQVRGEKCKSEKKGRRCMVDRTQEGIGKREKGGRRKRRSMEGLNPSPSGSGAVN